MEIYRVIHNGDVIGSSHLEYRDLAMAVAFGRFYPSPAYDTMRPIFRKFTHAQGDRGQSVDQDELKQYYAARDALGLKLVSSDGLELATGHIHIVDWEEDDDLEIEVQVGDHRFWGTVGSGWRGQVLG
ncbi:MAG TPA: hypothetical protein VF116_04545 [Ktedonobacterales bacterium]